VIGFNHELAQELVRSVNRLGIKNKPGSARILFDEVQAELVILEQMRAQIAHGHSLRLRALDQSPNCRFIKNNFQPVLVAEFLSELTSAGLEHLRLQFVSLDL